VRLVQLAQFLSLFKNVLKLKNIDKTTYRGSEQPTTDPAAIAENVSPVELEHAILKPQFNPLCGEIVQKLLAKNLAKITANQKEADESDSTY